MAAMFYKIDSNNYFLRLEKGEHLLEALQTFFIETNCQGGWISGIGGAEEVTLGCYNEQDKAHRWQTFKGFYEVTSLQGNVALSEEGQPTFHLHGTVSDENYQVYGGHIKDIVVGITFELYIQPSQQPLQRKMEASVGLQLLDI